MAHVIPSLSRNLTYQPILPGICRRSLHTLRLVGMTLSIIFTFVFLFETFNSDFALAQNLSYPIPDLGNCRNQQECYLYCQIPENSPACWSYGKYVMNTQEDVLGETTVNITYPISELGNCADANACFIYCNQPKNQSACYMYAKNNGLIKDDENTTNDISEEKMQEIISAAQTELGCSSKDACMSLCSSPDNYEKCHAFAVKYNLDRGGGPDEDHMEGLSREIVEQAKTELGCDGPQSCAAFCNLPQNGEKCFEFAKNHNLIREEEIQHRQEYTAKKNEMLEEAKTELGCDTYESCAKFCGDPSNVEKCMTLGRRHGMVTAPNQNNPPPKPCTNEAECRAYCEKNPQECKGFSERESQHETSVETKQELRYPSISGSPPPYTNKVENREMINNQNEHNKGEYLGPGGCKTESECKSYCEKHPNDCPGFPKDKVTPPPPNPSSQQTNSHSPLPLGNNSGGGSNSKPPEYKPPENKYEDINNSGNSGKYESGHD